MGKGGVGKTTVSASVGSIFAQLRQDDRVVAIDADTSFGKLGSRVDPQAQSSYWELATRSAPRHRSPTCAAGSATTPPGCSSSQARAHRPAAGARRGHLPRGHHAARRVLLHLGRATAARRMDSPVTQEGAARSGRLIVVSSPWVDGAATAGPDTGLACRPRDDGPAATHRRGAQRLGRPRRQADAFDPGRTVLQARASVVIEVPFDGHLRPGGVSLGPRRCRRPHRRRFLEIAAALAEHFPTHDDRRDQRASRPSISASRRLRVLQGMDCGAAHGTFRLAAAMVSSETPAAVAGLTDRQVGLPTGGIQALCPRGRPGRVWPRGWSARRYRRRTALSALISAGVTMLSSARARPTASSERRRSASTDVTRGGILGVLRRAGVAIVDLRSSAHRCEHRLGDQRYLFTGRRRGPSSTAAVR